MKPVVFNPAAVRDLDDITQFIANDNPRASIEVRCAILDTADLIGRFPLIGFQPAFRSKRHVGVRFLTVKKYRNYLVFYRESESEVEILRVLNSAQDYLRFFR